MLDYDHAEIKKNLEAKKSKNFGVELYKKGKYQSALKHFTDYLSKSPIFPSLTFLCPCRPPADRCRRLRAPRHVPLKNEKLSPSHGQL
jgi:hypothetical protein